jgi:hypothetical protein
MKQKSTYKILRLTLTLFFVFLSFFTQAKEKAELVINIADCRDAKNFAFLLELRILKNGKEFKILKPQNENKQVLKNLGFGVYTLVYKTMFEKEESLRVEIIENKRYSTNICTNYIDYSKDKYKPFINQLQENESYTILILSQGCFHSNQDTLTIKRNNDIFIFTWGTKSKKLSQSDIEKVRNFEIELNYMTNLGCTTVDTYFIKYNESTKKISDGSCSWNGNYFLKKQLFGDE